jgi:Zn-dependent protease/predicted transcriptional regulator
MRRTGGPSWSIRLLTMDGIDVKVHVSFVLILAWAAYVWAADTGRGWMGAFFGLVATLLLFAAVVLHELAHSWQARRYGIPIRDITLWPIGGVTRMERAADTPAQDLRIAIVGPLASLAVAGALTIVALLLGAAGLLGVGNLHAALGDATLPGLLAYLIAANLGLGLFNLLPAFPMDGGRVLRAALATRLGPVKATHLAVGLGQSLAWLMGFWGVMNGSVTLIVIAVFVYLAGSGEEAVVDARAVLGPLRVDQAMSRDVATLRPTDPLSRAIELTLATTQGSFAVVANDRLVGLLTDKDLLIGLRERGPRCPVGESMRAGIAAVMPGDSLFDAEQRMLALRVAALPVVDDGRLVGLLTAADVGEARRLLAPYRAGSAAA